MREILFRGRRLDNCEWEYGDMFQNHDERIFVGELVVTDVSSNRFCDKYEIGTYFAAVDPASVGQFTGMTDKNGKKIFEGDIVRYVYEPGEGYWNSNQNSVIKWREPGWYMEGIKGTNKYALMCGYMTTVPYASVSNEQKNIKVFEVIGNIHDNPELLEVENE